MSSEFTFGDNCNEFCMFRFIFMNLLDHDLTEYQITQTDVVMTAHTSGADKGNQTVHTHATR